MVGRWLGTHTPAFEWKLHASNPIGIEMLEFVSGVSNKDSCSHSRTTSLE
jgi:hypothetical protein